MMATAHNENGVDIMFHYTVETDKAISEATAAIAENLKEEGFGVLWQFNVNEKLAEKDLKLDNTFEILEVCNPFEAQKVLSLNKEVSYFLPCKIVIYDDAGRTKIGMPRPTKLMEILGDESVLEIAKNIEERMIASLDKSV